MSNIVNTRFAGFVRGLFRRSERVAAGASPLSASLGSSAPRPPAGALPEGGHLTVAPNSPPADNEELEIPLPVVLEKLPPELRVKMIKPISEFAAASLFVPVANVLPQLATGSVKIRFGTLRAAAPGLFRVGREYDNQSVALPLNEVLRRLSPKLFTRSPARRVVEVSDNIAGPFGGRPRPVAPAVTPVSRASNAPLAPQTPHAARPSSVVARPAAPAPGIAFSRPPERGAPAPNHFAAPPAPTAAAPATKPAWPTTTAAPAAAAVLAPLAALAEKWPEPMQAELAQLNRADAAIALPFDLLTAALQRGRVIFPWQMLRTWLKPTPISSVSARDNLELTLPLATLVPLFLAQHRPPARTGKALLPSDEIPDLISGTKLNSSVAQPPPVEPPRAPTAMATPAQPAAPAVPPPASASPKPISPAQVATQATTAAPTATPPPAPPPPAPSASAAPKPTVKPVDAYISKTDFYTFSDTGEAPQIDPSTVKRPQQPVDTDFLTRRTTPREIVGRAMTLPGVVGAVVALPDGLPVASQVPPGTSAERLAAFLPQIYNRVTQSAAELQMGEMDSLSFTVGGVPWTIFRANVLRDSTVYFAAFGRAGEPLSGAPLAALAAELDRRQQP